ncbi:16S rRNA processing protein RimM [Alkaliphilus pronyensis]|uniref:Ribosome maturation factor RimM n=1 Tax=Alkaliphilus pronyensis TaxID=1482732 RepID=A0A6I0F8Q7_9FIRM|nr:ribosome maturation factor RimM [Alkaliphilus pronyensis]KAB3535193.1 16S rRNA processing protein RimM [Alkaliphilus pronyensis]
MKFLRVGKIVNTHGIKGGLKVVPTTDYPERFEELEYVYLDKTTKLTINKIQYVKNMVIVTFQDYGDINLVEGFKGKALYIDESQRRELPEDTYYIIDLIGIDVYTVDEVYLGKVKDIIQTGPSEVYVIRNDEGKEVMIPAVKEFMPVIDIEAKKIIVKPIEGMI